MKHISEDELILMHYGEDLGQVAELQRHLDVCAQCATEMKKINIVLNSVEPSAIPERGEDYGEQVWRKVRSRLPEKREAAWVLGLRGLFSPQRLVFAGGLVALLLVAFLAGRMTQKPVSPAPTTAVNATQGRERVLLVAVGNHLERSQMVLVELINSEATGNLDISSEQERARELLNANRLYRQTAKRAGEPAVNQLLGELERVLLEIANGPSEVNAKQLAELQRQIESQGILLKVRIIGEKVREKERPVAKTPGQRQT